MNGSAERRREAIPPRALVSGKREAGEAHASIAQVDGSGTPATANSKSLEPVVNTTLPNFSGV